jgi:hypothetical protein
LLSEPRRKLLASESDYFKIQRNEPWRNNLQPRRLEMPSRSFFGDRIIEAAASDIVPTRKIPRCTKIDRVQSGKCNRRRLTSSTPRPPAQHRSCRCSRPPKTEERREKEAQIAI